MRSTSADKPSSLPSDAKRALQRDVLIAAVETGDQVLAPVLGPRDRHAQPLCEPDQRDIFRRQRHLLAEAAADIGRDDPQIRSGMPTRSAIAVRIRCGICVEQVSVMRPDTSIERGVAPRGSSGKAF